MCRKWHACRQSYNPFFANFATCEGNGDESDENEFGEFRHLQRQRRRREKSSEFQVLSVRKCEMTNCLLLMPPEQNHMLEVNMLLQQFSPRYVEIFETLEQEFSTIRQLTRHFPPETRTSTMSKNSMAQIKH